MTTEFEKALEDLRASLVIFEEPVSQIEFMRAVTGYWNVRSDQALAAKKSFERLQAAFSALSAQVVEMRSWELEQPVSDALQAGLERALEELRGDSK